MPSIAYLDLKYDKSYFTNKIYNNAITLTALVNDCQIGFYLPTSGTYYVDLSISYDNGMTWTDIHLPSGSGFYYPDPIDAGNTIMVVGRENHHNYGCNGLHIFSEEDNYFNVSGNLTSLLDTDFALVEREWPIVKGMMSNCFQNLFASFNVSNTTYTSYVKDASGLVFTNLDPTSYFYAGMFSGCTSLEKAPRTLSTKINSTSCCISMFNGCTSLTTAPELPATTLAHACYNAMFKDCTSLTTAPELPATTLANYCYEEMFNGCTSLSVIPRLPATTLAENCYMSMFRGCTSLTTAPELSATTLQPNCYREMFKGCISLTTAPQLPATTLASSCYVEMFNGCTSLNYIKILATSWASSSYLEDYITDWVYNVAPTGIFVKDTNTTYEIDSDSGVPTGWTVYDVGEYIPQSYTITLTVDPNGSGTVSGAGTYQEGSGVALIATPETGYRFVGWYDHYGTLVSTNTMYIFTINRHEDFLAQFAETDIYAHQYLTIESLAYNNTIRFKKSASSAEAKTIYWSSDKTTWNSVSSDTGIIKTLSNNEKIYIKGNNNSYASPTQDYYNYFSSDYEFNISGNIMSLIYGDNFIGQTTLPSESYIFASIFRNSKVVDASNLILPATTLATTCYWGMFYHCDNLTTAPELPATTCAEGCYAYMYFCCYNLQDPGTIYATTLANECMHSMYTSCRSLHTGPVLLAEKMVRGCYNEMYSGCVSLSYVEVHLKYKAPAGEWGMYYMFGGGDQIFPDGRMFKVAGVEWMTREYLNSELTHFPDNWTLEDI